MKHCVNRQFYKVQISTSSLYYRGVGAVLSQRDENGCDRPIAFYSKKLLPRETRYSTECLAIKLGVEAFRVYLIGRKFMIQTDHRSLIWLNKLKEKNARQCRWSLSLQDYVFDVEHRAGVANSNADALSRAVHADTTDCSLLLEKEGEV